MSQNAHKWVVAPREWGCTALVDGEQCSKPAILACRGKTGDCDGNEGRCGKHADKDREVRGRK